TRWRRCPARADIPNQRIANGGCAPRWKRPILPVSGRGLSVRRSDSTSRPTPRFTLVVRLMGFPYSRSFSQMSNESGSSSRSAMLCFGENCFLHFTKIETQPQQNYAEEQTINTQQRRDSQSSQEWPREDRDSQDDGNQSADDI